MAWAPIQIAYKLEHTAGRGRGLEVLSASNHHHLARRPSFLSHMSTSGMDSKSAGSQPPMPAANADLATTWAYLEEGVDHIMTKLQTGVSYSKYMSLYTVSYNYCTSSRMHTGPGPDGGMAGRSACFRILSILALTAFVASSRRESHGIRSV